MLLTYVTKWMNKQTETETETETLYIIGTVIPRLTSDPANEFFG